MRRTHHLQSLWLVVDKVAKSIVSKAELRPNSMQIDEALGMGQFYNIKCEFIMSVESMSTLPWHECVV